MKAAACLVTVIFVATTAQMQSDEVIAKAYRTVNVRSGPSTEYDIIGQLNSGNETRITGRSDQESNWLRIAFGAQEGWVAYFTVTVVGDASTLPVVEALADRADASNFVSPTPTVAHRSGDVYMSTFRRVNVRSGPGMEYQRIGALDPGNSADITGRTNDNEWLQIDFDGQQGWIAYFVVTVTGSLGDVAVAGIPVTAMTRVPPKVQVVTRYNVNLRAEPVIGSPIIDVIPFDTTLTTDARANNDGTWLRVSYNGGEQGWLLSRLVNINGSLGTLPIIQPAAAGG